MTWLLLFVVKTRLLNDVSSNHLLILAQFVFMLCQGIYKENVCFALSLQLFVWMFVCFQSLLVCLIRPASYRIKEGCVTLVFLTVKHLPGLVLYFSIFKILVISLGSIDLNKLKSYSLTLCSS